MDEQMQVQIRAASLRGDDVVMNVEAHIVTLLRGLADDIESGKQVVGIAEMRMLQEHAPYAVWVVTAKDA
jgi:hypothetical protein